MSNKLKNRGKEGNGHSQSILGYFFPRHKLTPLPFPYPLQNLARFPYSFDVPMASLFYYHLFPSLL